MATKITIELSRTELAHVEAALLGEQADHERRMGRSNPALSRVQNKLTAARQEAEKQKPEAVEDAEEIEES